MAQTKLKDFITEQQRTKEYIKDIKDLVEERTLGNADVKQALTIVENVTTNTEYGYYGSVEGVTRKDTGCGMEPVPFDVPVRTGWWEPVALRATIRECYSALENSFLQWASKKGIKKIHIEDTDFVNFLAERFGNAIQTDFNKFVFFGNKEASNVGSGSGSENLKAGVAKENYNVINGLYTQFFKMVTTDASKRVTIAENAQNTFAAQSALARDTAFNAFTALIDKADPLTFADGSQPIFLATHSMVTNLSRYLRSEYKNELTLDKMEGGYMVGEFEGIPIVTHRWFDEIIRRDFSNGTKWDNPHRVILLDKSECQVGIDSMGSLNDIEIEYVGGKDEHVYLKAAYRMDFQRVIGTTGAMAI